MAGNRERGTVRDVWVEDPAAPKPAAMSSQELVFVAEILRPMVKIRPGLSLGSLTRQVTPLVIYGVGVLLTLIGSVQLGWRHVSGKPFKVGSQRRNERIKARSCEQSKAEE